MFVRREGGVRIVLMWKEAKLWCVCVRVETLWVKLGVRTSFQPYLHFGILLEPGDDLCPFEGVVFR